MFFSLTGLVRRSFGVTVAAHVAGILLAGTVTALGSYRVATTLLAEAAPAERPRVAAAVQSGQQSLEQSTTDLSSERQAFMSPSRAGLGGLQSMPRSLSHPAQFFGGSSRHWGSSRSYRDDDEYDDDYSDYDNERPRVAGTYRTLCVRLCDGYYFPVSVSATRSRFAHDAKICEKSCGSQARLFVHANPGADIEDMVDLRGQPYSKLKTAFRYRMEYVSACRCKPDPWDAEARDRHRMYALVAAKRKGDKQAAAELEALVAKMKLSEAAQREQVATSTEESQAGSDSGRTRAADQPRRSDRADDQRDRMGLGARNPPEPRERPSRAWTRDPDWMDRAFGRAF